MTVSVYTFGVCHCSVCASKLMTREQVVAETNIAHPTGLDHGWEISPEKFADGSPNPGPCNVADGCLHYLMVC